MSAAVTAGIIEVLLNTAGPIITKMFGGRAGDSLLHELKLKLLEGDIETAKGVRDIAKMVVENEMQQESFFYRGVRPSMLWLSLWVVLQWVVLNPMLIFFFERGFPLPELSAIPKEIWWIILASWGIYAPARSLDKHTRVRQLEARYEKTRKVEYELSNKVEHEYQPRKRYEVSD